MSTPEFGPDVVAAVVAFLMDDEGVTEWIGEGATAAIAGDELPAGESATMPKPYIVVSRSGGSGGPGARSWMEVDSARLDVRCWGTSPANAAALGMRVKAAMKSMAREVCAGVLLHDSIEAGGLRDTREPDGVGWPLCWGAYVVMYSEVSVL